MSSLIFQKQASAKQKRGITTSAVAAEKSSNVAPEEEQKCIDKITAQGQKVRDLKAAKASKVSACFEFLAAALEKPGEVVGFRAYGRHRILESDFRNDTLSRRNIFKNEPCFWISSEKIVNSPGHPTEIYYDMQNVTVTTS